MTVTKVAGTPLAAAIAAAQPGDTLALAAGGYAAVDLPVTKPLLIEGDGGALLVGAQEDGHVGLDVASKAVSLRGLNFAHGGAAVRFRGDCTGSLLEWFAIGPVDFMVRNTAAVAGDDNGGNAVAFSRGSGATVRDGQIRNARARSFDYKVDGGAFEFYEASGITVERVETWDCVNVAEFGHSQAGPLNTDIAIRDCTFHGRLNPDITPNPYTVANGIILRALERATIAGNIFDLLDWWAFDIHSAAAGFAGPVRNVATTDNVFRLGAGTNRMFALDGATVMALPASGLAFDRSRIYVQPTTIVGQTPKSQQTTLADLQALGFEAANAYFGDEAAYDPAAGIKAQLATVTADRDALAALRDRLHAETAS